MDSSREDLQNILKLFSNNLVFKIKFFSKNIKAWIMDIDQIAMCCISMDSSQRSLQTNEKFFSNLK